MAEVRYQVDEMLFKMTALSRGSNLPDKPIMYYTDTDSYGMGAGDTIYTDSEVLMFGNMYLILNIILLKIMLTKKNKFL